MKQKTLASPAREDEGWGGRGFLREKREEIY